VELMKKAENNASSSIHSRRFRIGTYSIIYTIVVIAIIAIINLAINRLPSTYTSLDMTSNSLFNLSEQTKQIVSGLEDEVTVYWMVQTGYEESKVQTLLDRYSDLSDNFKVVTKDPIVYPNFAKQYTDEDLYNNSLIVVCGDRVKYVSYYEIFVYDYTNYYTDGSYDVSFDGENALTKALDYVTSDNLPKLYQLKGHGEAAMSAGFESSIRRENIQIEDLTLLSTGKVPDDAGCVLIFSPTSDITENEKDMILEYLKAGGDLMLITSFDEKDYPNLDAVMEYYGAERVNGIIMEGDKSHYASGYNYYLLPDMESHEISDPLIDNNYIVFVPAAHGIKVLEGVRDTLVTESILNTSESAYVKTDLENISTIEKEEGDPEGPFSVCVAASEPVGEETTHVVWFSSAAFFDDSANEMVSGGNQDLAINAVGWICERKNTISIHSKALSSEQMTVPTGKVTQLSLLLVGAIPLIFIIAGIAVVVRRRRR
jgi:ABC-2 type transport system permease protein